MKTPLDYTEHELKTLSIHELKILLSECESLENKFNTEQTVMKLNMNSLFGAQANKWFPLFNETIANAITGNGRYFIRKIAIYVEKGLQEKLPSPSPYVIYGDTDSIYFQIAAFVELYVSKNPSVSLAECVEFAHQFEIKIIQPIIKQCILDFSRELNAMNSEVIGCEREIIADIAVFTEKKKYYARVRDSEGTRYDIDNPYIKIMGLDIIKSTTPIWSKARLREAIPLILDKSESDIRAWVREIKEDFIKVPLTEIAQIGGVSNLSYTLGEKGIPIGARSALRHNNYIQKQNMLDRIAPIVPGDKCKKLFLREPNRFQTNVISYTNDRFTLELKDSVDYDTQFEKGFMKPLSLMTNCLNYDLSKETEEIDDW